MKSFSEKDFLDYVDKAPWEQVVQSSNDISELVIKCTSLFFSLIDKNASYREISVSEKFALGFQLTLKILSEKETS